MSSPSTFGSGSVLITADGPVDVSGVPTRIYSIHIISGGTPAVVSLKNGTSSSATAWITETGTASTGATFRYGTYGALFPNGCFVDVDGNTTSVLVSYSQ